MENLTGSVEHIIFHNDQNGYTVADFDSEGVLNTVVGFIDSPREGMYLKLTGDWATHPVFGEQFKFTDYAIEVPTTEEGLVRYLSSGLLPGIGEKKAKDIVAHFGTDVLDVLDHTPERLGEISGIGAKTLAGIIEAYSEQRDVREIILALQEYGISVAYGMKLYKVYGTDTVAVLFENPYQIIKDVPGIGFRIADQIAARLEITADHPQRLAAGVIQSLRECYASGNTYLTRNELMAVTADLLGICPDALEDTIDTMLINGDLRMELVGDQEAFYHPSLFEAEDVLAMNMVRLIHTASDAIVPDTEDAIDAFEETAGMRLDASQRRAVSEALSSRVAIITGGPGTGKTTIVSAVIAIMIGAGKKVVLCAPTGRAAKRMAEATGQPAKTIHRLLEYEPSGDENFLRFGRDEENPLEEDIVIVDEASMVDTVLMASLIRAIRPEMRLILVGDVDQLPSVGPGQVLRDLIESNLFPVVRLTAIYRQAKGSAIAETAGAVNDGLVPEISRDSDVRFIRKQSPESALETVLALAGHFKDIQIITPMKKGALGTIALNTALQGTLNPPSENKNEKAFGAIIFREGDKVMQIRNDYRLAWKDAVTAEEGEGVFNGDIGIITEIDHRDKKLTVRMMDDKIVEYGFDDLNALIHAYAMTVHKSQGSEFSKVVIPLVGGPPSFLTRKLLYTAITRAKEQLFLVGPWPNFVRMIYSDQDALRRTGLKERIALYQGIL